MKTSSTADFLRDFNAAFFSGDHQYFEQHVTEDVKWIMVGALPLIGKSAVLDAAFGMKDYTKMEFNIDTVIADGNEGVVKGVITSKGGNERTRTYCYCDLYEWTGDLDPKIQKITSFVVEIEAKKEP